MFIIGFVFFVICLIAAAILAYTYGIERPANARAGTQTAEAVAGAQTEEAHPAPTPTDEPLQIEDNFQANVNYWLEGTDEDRQGGTMVRDIRDSKYYWTIDSENGRFWWAFGPTEDVTLRDYSISVEAELVEGDPEVIDSGLILNTTHDGSYAFGIYYNGFWYFSRYSEDDDKWTGLDHARSAVIHVRGTNQLFVRVRNGHFTLFINDEKVGYVEDNIVRGGSAGLFVGTEGSEKPATVAFDNFEIHDEQPAH